MRVPAPRLWVLVGAVAIVCLVFETRRLAELAGRHEAAARDARTEHAALQHAHEILTAEHAARGAAIDRLERELAQALEQSHAVTASLEQRIGVEAAQQKARAVEAELLNQPPPELVRIALRALAECFAADGFTGLRFVRATALADRMLRGVELLELAPDGFTSALIVADRVTVELDRSKALLTLRCADGFRLVEGQKEALPVGGLPLEFRPVTGRLFEERLPYLIAGRGAYPVEPKPAGSAPDEIDPRTRADWLARWNAFFSALGGGDRYRLVTFNGLKDGRLLAARLHAYDRSNLLVMTADVGQLAVEIDEAAGIVSLLLQDGVLHRKGGASSISADGYRMLLENVTPRQASDALLGLAVRK